jgi:riboflavin synthase
VFTGIVRELGRVAAVDGDADGLRLAVDAPHTAPTVAVGDSVAVNGVCLTATEIDGVRVSFFAMRETLDRSALGRVDVGDAVNLEPALRAGEPLGGHVLQGHVDGVAQVRSVEDEGESRRIWFDAPPELLRYCVEKGSVALDGVSLTVAGLADTGLAVALIPHTLAETTLGSLAPGDEVSVEVDVLAKYVERLVTMDR